ncbi:hypothetical protein D3C72_2350170 [compost metagenome]
MFGVSSTVAFASPAAMAEKMSGTASIETTRMSEPGFRPASLIAWMAPTAMSSLWA